MANVNTCTFSIEQGKTHDISFSRLVTLDSSHNQPSPVHG